MRIKWSKQRVIEEIKRRKEKNLPLSAKAVRLENSGLYDAARRYFGEKGWRKAMYYAGLNPYDFIARRIWKKRDVIKKIFLLHYKDNKPLNRNYLTLNGHIDLVMAGTRFFGSWGKAINASGLNYDEIKASRCKWWTKEKIMSEIRRLNSEEVQLSSKYIQQARADLYGAAKYHYIGWGQAVEAAGIDYSIHCKVWSYKVWLRNENLKEERII